MRRAIPELDTAVDLKIVPTEQPVHAYRSDDPAPHRGGASILRSDTPTTGVACSSAFPARRAVGIGLYEYGMVTAAHCRRGFWTSRSGIPQGNTASMDEGWDIQVYTVGSASSQMWYGSWYGNSSGQTTKSMSGRASNNVGDYVCVSGAPSGSICNIRINALKQTADYQGYGIVSNLVRADHVNQSATVGMGDSGGPVFNLDPIAARARGVISGVPGRTSTYTRPCRGEPTSTDRFCSYRLYYSGSPVIGLWSIYTG